MNGEVSWPMLHENSDIFDNDFFAVPIIARSFYRAMHFSAKRGIAIACRLSVCPSVRL